MPSSGDDEVAILTWVHDTEIGKAGCVTFVAGADVASVARGFGGRAGDATTMTLREAEIATLYCAGASANPAAQKYGRGNGRYSTKNVATAKREAGS